MDDPPSLPPRTTPPAGAIAATQPLVIPARFCGPPGSGNGGYVAGRLAAYLPAPGSSSGAIEVTLRRPPPLQVELWVQRDEDPGPLSTGRALRLRHEQTVVATAAPVQADLEPVEPVSFADAGMAEAGYPGLREHPFPGCFVCGTGRQRPDGLVLRPGPAPGRGGMTACTWVPDASLADPQGEVVLPEMVWAALDCPGGWATDIAGRPAVLGRMTAQIDALPFVGERCVVTGRVLDRAGRKSYTATTVYDADDRVLARATAVWIEVDPTTAGKWAGAPRDRVVTCGVREEGGGPTHEWQYVDT